MAMNEYSLADIAAVADGAGGNRGNGGGWGNGDGWWVLILIALLGGFNGGFGGWGGGGYAGGNELYPWLNQAQLTTQGFADQNAIMALNGISSGVQNLSTQLCNCCADMQMAVASGFANAETAANARQMASMQQAFNAQLATQQGFNGVQSDLCQGFNGGIIHAYAGSTSGLSWQASRSQGSSPHTRGAPAPSRSTGCLPPRRAPARTSTTAWLDSRPRSTRGSTGAAPHTSRLRVRRRTTTA